MSQMKVRVKPQMELVLKHKDDKDNAQALEGALSTALPFIQRRCLTANFLPFCLLLLCLLFSFAHEAAAKLASVSSDAIYAREILQEGVLPMLLHVVQDHPLTTQKVTLALLQVLSDLAPSVPNAEAIMEAWSPNKVHFSHDARLDLFHLSHNPTDNCARSRNFVRCQIVIFVCRPSILLPAWPSMFPGKRRKRQRFTARKWSETPPLRMKRNPHFLSRP